MARLKPYSGRSHDRLTALINSNNQLALQENINFTFGVPTVINGINGRNTAVTFNPVDFQLYDIQTLHYKRLSLAILGTLPVEEILPVTITQVPFTILSILTDINESLGLDLEPSEIQDELFTTVSTQYRIRIKDSASSLGWTASEFYFTADHQQARLMEDGTPRLMEDGSIRMMEVI